MRNVYWGIALVIFGVLLLLENLDVADMGDIIRTYWPLLLILWGASILTRRDRRGQSALSASAAPPIERELLHESHVFENINLTIASSNFKGGSISTVFGNCIVDLSGTTVAEGEHVLRLHSVFGDTLVKLPRGCAAVINASSVLGNANILGQQRGGFAADIGVATSNFGSATNRLNISASKIFGNITIEEAQ
jgi:predicted membrane protein